MSNVPVLSWDDSRSFLEDLINNDIYSDTKRDISGPTGNGFLIDASEDKGGGYIEMFNFNDGLKMLVLNCHWHNPISSEIRDDDYLRFNFSLKLDITMDMGAEVISAHDPCWRLINNAPGVIAKENFNPDSDNIWITLIFKEEYLERIYGEDIWSRHPCLDILRKRSNRTLHKEFPFDHQLNLVSSQIVSLNVGNEVFCTMAHAKAVELLSFAIDRLITNIVDKNHTKVSLNSASKKALQLAKNILLANIASPPTVKELCSAVGINRNKLHYGFKSEFGKTPQQLLDDKRLSTAYEFLKENNKKIYEIALDVGYTNQGSFATAFKRKFGCTPKEVRDSFST